jgi:hypothetical protein
MSSDTVPPPRIHHQFSSDLSEIRSLGEKYSLQGRRLYCVLSDVLSDLKIYSGDVLEMRSLAPEESLAPYSIVAVRFVWTGVLLLRQFVPPKILITNSGKGNLPHLHLSRSWRAVAFLDQGITNGSERTV